MTEETPPAPPASYDKKVGLVLQGGGALGSYQAGVYEARASADYMPDWVAGICIGAVNAAIIEGSRRSLAQLLGRDHRSCCGRTRVERWPPGNAGQARRDRIKDLLRSETVIDARAPINSTSRHITEMAPSATLATALISATPALARHGQA